MHLDNLCRPCDLMAPVALFQQCQGVPIGHRSATLARHSANFTHTTCWFVPDVVRLLGPPGAGVAMGGGCGAISFVSQKISDSDCSWPCWAHDRRNHPNELEVDAPASLISALPPCALYTFPRLHPTALAISVAPIPSLRSDTMPARSKFTGRHCKSLFRFAALVPARCRS